MTESRKTPRFWGSGIARYASRSQRFRNRYTNSATMAWKYSSLNSPDLLAFAQNSCSTFWADEMAPPQDGFGNRARDEV